MKLDGILFTTPSSYIQRIETSYNTLQYDLIYDSELNLNLPPFVSTYSIKNY